MKNRRMISLILALLLALPLAGCSQTDDSGITTDTAADQETTQIAETETEETRLVPDIPATADYGGDEIRFLHWMLEEWEPTVRASRDIYAAELNGEAINDAVYNRNISVESSYNVKIALEKMQLSQIDSAVNKAVTAGDNTYDVIYPRLYEAAGMYPKGYFINLLDVPYIDLEKPWWDPSSVESLTVMGKLPAVATSINVNDKDATVALAFNKEYAEAHNLPDLYSMVKEGKWTIDKLSEYSAVAATDTDGDGVMTEEDIYGFLGGNDVMDALYRGIGSTLVTRDDDGAYIFSYGSERDIDGTDKVVKLMNEEWFFNHHTAANTDDIYYRQLFESGKGLFFWMRLDEVTNMREGDADFGIIPVPKLEESQDTYYSMVSQHTTGLMSVPKTQGGEKLEEIGLVLEAMAAISHYDLIPAYIESSLKTKHSRDAESAEMLDIIIGNRIFDPMLIYNFGDFANLFMSFGYKNNTAVASTIETNKDKVEAAIQKLADSMAE